MDIHDTPFLEGLPQFPIESLGSISKDFLALGITDFHVAVQYVRAIPYGRNSKRSHYQLVLTENVGTCSTKHAFLAQLCAEQQRPDIALTLGIYQMSENNTPGVGQVLEKHGLNALPEAHCYLKVDHLRFDFTTMSADMNRLGGFVFEEAIQPEDIGEYKVERHKSYLQNWMEQCQLNKTLEEVWAIRESCIQALSNKK